MTDSFITEAKKIHGDKYDYSKTIYINSNTKIKIICRLHGEFEQFPYNHLSGNNCQKCFKNNQKMLIHKKNKVTFIERAKIKYGSKFNYSKVNYIDCTKLVTIICPIHGEFEQSPRNHLLSKTGCTLCGIHRGGDSVKLSVEEFIKRAQLIHGNKYLYDKVIYINIQTNIIIICKLHGEFEQRPDFHLQGHIGCKKCLPINYSNSSIKWLEYIQEKDKIYIQHAENDKEYNIPNTKYKADGYCEANNTIYEFHGCMFHGCPKCYDENKINPIIKKQYKDLYKRTLDREQLIRSMGYNLITIWEHDWKSIKNDINKVLSRPKFVIKLKKLNN